MGKEIKIEQGVTECSESRAKLPNEALELLARAIAMSVPIDIARRRLPNCQKLALWPSAVYLSLAETYAKQYLRASPHAFDSNPARGSATSIREFWALLRKPEGPSGTLLATAIMNVLSSSVVPDRVLYKRMCLELDAFAHQSLLAQQSESKFNEDVA